MAKLIERILTQLNIYQLQFSRKLYKCLEGWKFLDDNWKNKGGIYGGHSYELVSTIILKNKIN